MKVWYHDEVTGELGSADVPDLPNLNQRDRLVAAAALVTDRDCDDDTIVPIGSPRELVGGVLRLVWGDRDMSWWIAEDEAAIKRHYGDEYGEW